MKHHRPLLLILTVLLTLLLSSRSAGADPEPPTEIPDAIVAPADIVHADDVIIDGALCIGENCVVDGFGALSLQLENRFPTIRFLGDGSGTFVPTDWIIVTNDGSRSYFAIYNNLARVLPLFIDSTGDIGMGTIFPQASLHISRTLSVPTLRFTDVTDKIEQNWILSAGQNAFALTDNTHGSTPLLVEADAPDFLLWLDDLGRVGVGGIVPDATLHVSRSDGSTRLHVGDKSATAGERTLALLSNKGAINLQFDNTDVNRQWSMGVRSGGNFRIQSNQAAAGVVNFEMNLDGALTLSGNLTVGSCSGCTAIRSAASPIASLADLTFRRWRTRDAVEHIAPDMATFRDQTGLGSADGIAPLDVASVALMSVQSLQIENRQLWKENAVLRGRVDDVSARIAALEAALGVESQERIYLPSAGR